MRRQALARRWAGASLAAAVGAAGASGCGSAPSPSAALARWAAAVDRQDWAAATAASTGPEAPGLASAYRSVRAALQATRSATSAGPVRTSGSTATAALTTTVATADLGPVALHGTATLRPVGGTWRVAWTPATLESALAGGGRVERRTTWPARGQVLGAGGVSLTPPAVTVGLVGSRITDAGQVGSLLEAAGFPAPAVTADLARAAAAPSQLVPVGVLPDAAYRAIRAQPGPNLYSVSGTAFASGSQAPLTPDLGAHLVGTVGPVTADQLARLGPPYTASSRVGQGGIEAQDERALAGTPAVAAVVVGPSGSTTATLASTPARPGADVTTSIDPAVERAAEAAASTLPASAQAAVVVERASTGEVLASVSRPLSTPFDLALDGQVPPGSTFKVVTATDLLEHGATPATPATCPATVTVDGQSFRNFEGEAGGTITLARAFAISCNTAFIGLSAGLPAASLPEVAAQYGLGSAARPGVAVAATSVPAPTSANAQAATAIGQASVVVSPLAMASVAAPPTAAPTGRRASSPAAPTMPPPPPPCPPASTPPSTSSWPGW